jgi:tetratricopeptide (TPR) repeat protein
MESTLINRAELLLEQNRPKEALDILRAVLSKDPNNIQTLALMSEAHLEMGQGKESQTLIESAIGLAPDIAPLHYIKAKVMMSQKKFDEAEKSFFNASTLDPSEADYFAIWAMVKNIRKQFTEGLELAERALELQPDNINALNARSTSLTKLGRKEESARSIEGALREDPNNAFTHANYGWSELERGSHTKAMEHFKEALKNDPTMEFAQAGMMEALKARYFLYRLFLKYVFWMSNLTSKYQWAVIIGFYIGFRIIRSVADNNPALAPYLNPLIILLTIVAFSTWITTPISNLFLRFNPYGKHLLDKKEIDSSNLVGISLVLAIVGLLLYIIDGSDLWLGLSAFGIGMMIPCSTIFSSAKNKMALPIYTIAMAILGVLGLMVIFQGGALFNLFSTLFIFALVGFQWFANFMLIKQNNH